MFSLGKRAVRSAVNGLGYQTSRLGGGETGFDPSRCLVTHGRVDGVEYRWFVENPLDKIQAHHAEGRIYEIEELRALRDLVGEPDTFVDIGANVGNHTLYAALGMGARHIVAFEPGRKQHDILAVNIALNSVADRFTVHKCALSDAAGAAWMTRGSTNNLGMAKLSTDGHGEAVEVVCGDDLLRDLDVQCIKIDVEGHEMNVLSGLGETVSRNRPVILAEIDEANERPFQTFMGRYDYKAHLKLKKKGRTTNYIMRPV